MLTTFSSHTVRTVLWLKKYISMTAKGLKFISPNHKCFYSNENYRKRTNNTASSGTWYFFLRRVCVNACKPFFLLREKVNVNELFISTLADYTNFCFTPSPQHRVAATDPLFPVDVKSLPSNDLAPERSTLTTPPPRDPPPILIIYHLYRLPFHQYTPWGVWVMV